MLFLSSNSVRYFLKVLHPTDLLEILLEVHALLHTHISDVNF